MKGLEARPTEGVVTPLKSLRMASGLVMLLATVVFVIGISAERSFAGEANEVRPAESSAITSAEELVEEDSEGHEEGEATEESTNVAAVGHDEDNEVQGEEAHADDAAAAHNEASETGETTLGIDPESTAAVATATVISLVLVAALWCWGTPAVLIVATVFALLFTALDLREVAHQVNEERSGLAVVAALAAVLHGAAAVLAALALTARKELRQSTR